jgi:hypothetical protein
MNGEVEIAVRDVLSWLDRGAAPDEARALLVGCSLDDDSGLDAVAIVDVDVARRALILQTGRRLLLKAARDGLVLDARPGAPLAAAVQAARSPADIRDRAERAELARAGIAAERLASHDDRRIVLRVLRMLASAELPDGGLRHAFYMALRAGADPGVARVGARFFADMLAMFSARGAAPEDLHWRLTWCLRTAGQLPDAVASSEVLHNADLRDPGARKLLATTRAGALLDLFEARGEAALLERAERCLKIAWALGPGDEEASALYRRLERLREMERRGR